MPVVGESGKVVAYRVFDDRDDRQVMVVPASSVKVERPEFVTRSISLEHGVPTVARLQQPREL